MICQFYLSSQRNSFWLCWFLLWSLVLLVFISALIFKISFFLLTLGFFISSFSSFFRCRVGYLFDLFLVSWGMPILVWTFPLALLLQCPTGLGLLCFHFHSFPCIFWFLFWFLLWFVGYSAACYSASICWNFYWFLSCDWDLILLHCGQKRCLEWFQFFFFLIYQG